MIIKTLCELRHSYNKVHVFLILKIAFNLHFELTFYDNSKFVFLCFLFQSQRKKKIRFYKHLFCFFYFSSTPRISTPIPRIPTQIHHIPTPIRLVICKSRNGESGMMGMRGIWVGIRGIMVGMQGIRVGT